MVYCRPLIHCARGCVTALFHHSTTQCYKIYVYVCVRTLRLLAGHGLFSERNKNKMEINYLGNVNKGGVQTNSGTYRWTGTRNQSCWGDVNGHLLSLNSAEILSDTFTMKYKCIMQNCICTT